MNYLNGNLKMEIGNLKMVIGACESKTAPSAMKPYHLDQ
jgi:hypothetical protein